MNHFPKGKEKKVPLCPPKECIFHTRSMTTTAVPLTSPTLNLVSVMWFDSFPLLLSPLKIPSNPGESPDVKKLIPLTLILLLPRSAAGIHSTTIWIFWRISCTRVQNLCVTVLEYKKVVVVFQWFQRNQISSLFSNERITFPQTLQRHPLSGEGSSIPGVCLQANQVSYCSK